jgi:hypothetical protein
MFSIGMLSSQLIVSFELESYVKTVSVARNNAANKYLAMYSFTRNFEKKPLLFKTQLHLRLAEYVLNRNVVFSTDCVF